MENDRLLIKCYGCGRYVQGSSFEVWIKILNFVYAVRLYF
jgi:hypothetical protein